MTTDKPSLSDGVVSCPQGWGYWDLSFYPWGGEFRRFAQDSTATLDRVVDTYTDGSPRRIVAKLGTTTIGIQL